MTSYVNASLQCIIAMDDLWRDIECQRLDIAELGTDTADLVVTVLVQSLRREYMEAQHVVSNKQVTRFIRLINREMRDDVQDDAQEFVSCVLSKVQSCLSDKRLIQGCQIIEYSCEVCGMKTSTNESFLMLTVDLLENDNTSIQSAIAKMTKPQTTSFRCNCHKDFHHPHQEKLSTFTQRTL